MDPSVVATQTRNEPAGMVVRGPRQPVWFEVMPGNPGVQCRIMHINTKTSSQVIVVHPSSMKHTQRKGAAAAAIQTRPPWTVGVVRQPSSHTDCSNIPRQRVLAKNTHALGPDLEYGTLTGVADWTTTCMHGRL